MSTAPQLPPVAVTFQPPNVYPVYVGVPSVPVDVTLYVLFAYALPPFTSNVIVYDTVL